MTSVYNVFVHSMLTGIRLRVQFTLTVDTTVDLGDPVGCVDPEIAVPSPSQGMGVLYLYILNVVLVVF